MAPDSSYSFLEMNTRLQVEHPVTELRHRARPGAAADPRCRRGSRCRPRRWRRRSPATRSRCGSTPRTRPNGFLPVTGTLRELRDRTGGPLRSTRCRVGQRGVAVLRRDDRQGDRARAHSRRGCGEAGRGAARVADPRRDDQPRSAGADPRRGRVPCWRHRHGVPRSARSRPCSARRCSTDARAIVTTQRPRHSRCRRRTALRRGCGRGLPSGWRNNPSQPQHARACGRRRTSTSSTMQSARRWRESSSTSTASRSTSMSTRPALSVGRRDDGRGAPSLSHVPLPADGRTVDVDSPLGASSLRRRAAVRRPVRRVAAGSLVAPMPGAVVRVLVEAGATVAKGDPLVVLEAMKMEHTVASPADGTVSEVRVQAGQQVDAGSVLVVVEHWRDGVAEPNPQRSGVSPATKRWGERHDTLGHQALEWRADRNAALSWLRSSRPPSRSAVPDRTRSCHRPAATRRRGCPVTSPTANAPVDGLGVGAPAPAVAPGTRARKFTRRSLLSSRRPRWGSASPPQRAAAARPPARQRQGASKLGLRSARRHPDREDRQPDDSGGEEGGQTARSPGTHGPCHRRQGGYVSSQQRQPRRQEPIRRGHCSGFPWPTSQDAIAAARSSGKSVSLTTSADDVTGKYVDLTARLHALERTRSTYLTILVSCADDRRDAVGAAAHRRRAAADRPAARSAQGARATRRRTRR